MKQTDFFHRRRLPFFLAVFLLLSCQPAAEESITPESLGISSRAILDFIEAAETTRKDELHGFVILKNGQEAAKGWWAPYNAESPHMLFSLSKSFTSTAIGLAQAEGLLSIYDPVISFFPEQAPAEPSANLQAMRIKDLLRMASGHDQDTWPRIQQNQESWVKEFLSLAVEHKPGTHFVYNTGATFMLAAIIQKVTGQTLLEYLQLRLFQPLGIQNPTWESNMNGINKGGTGLNIRTEDIAKFGQLFLQRGKWQGKQLVPEEWIQEATAIQVANGSNPESDWAQGYGYQFWRCRPKNVYRGDGAFGQFCIVMPDQETVVAITSGSGNMQAIMNLVWDHLFPAMQGEPLPDDPEAYQALQAKLSSLTLSTVSTSEAAPGPSIQAGVYHLDENTAGLKALKLNPDDQSITFYLQDYEFVLPFSKDTLIQSRLDSSAWGAGPAASSGGWIAENTLAIRSYFYETPYYADLKLTFNQDQVNLSQKMNVAFGGSTELLIRGRKE